LTGPTGPGASGGRAIDWYGNGADGPLVVAGTTTLDRDMFWTTLVINPGAILETAGYRVFANVSIVNDGTIQFEPGDADNAGNGGFAPHGSLPKSRNGAFAGGQQAGVLGFPGNAMFPGTSGNGGAGGFTTFGGGGGPTTVSTIIDPHLGGMDLVLFGVTWFPLSPTIASISPNAASLSWGASGGGGAQGGVGVGEEGAGGGSGGGIIVLSSPTITGSGVVRARGGFGGSAGGGGGGGGQGGVIALITDNGASPIATDVPGGMGGPAGFTPGATAGDPGSAGVVRQYPTLA
jgi:hypothetical protein